MIDNDYTFGETHIYCDNTNCENELTVEGYDKHPPQWDEIKGEMDSADWVSKKIGGDWLHFCCVDCYKEFMKKEKANE